jgi:hypothetical protein
MARSHFISPGCSSGLKHMEDGTSLPLSGRIEQRGVVVVGAVDAG